MYSRLVSAMYALNLLISALFCLLTPIGLLTAAAWLLNTRCGVGEYVYAILIPLGTAVGLISMIRFLLRSSEALERIEKARKPAAPPTADPSKEKNTHE